MSFTRWRMFAEAFSELGGRCDDATEEAYLFRDSIAAAHQSLVGLAWNHFDASRRQPITFGFYSSDKHLCRSIKFNGQYFIGMSAHLPRNLDALFYKLTSFPELSSAFQLDNYNHSIAEYESQRHVVCGLLGMIVMEAVLNHEIAHIAHGHLDFIEEDPSRKEDLDVSQILEMDADCYSASRLLDSLVNRLSNRSSVPPIVARHLGDPNVATFTCLFAIYAYFRSKAKVGPLLDLLEANHPPAQLRMHLFLASYLSKLDRARSSCNGTTFAGILAELGGAQSSLTEVVVLAERSLEFVDGCDYDRQPVEQSLSDQAIETYNNYLRGWARILPDIRRFAWKQVPDEAGEENLLQWSPFGF